jgi:hypothetical protein
MLDRMKTALKVVHGRGLNPDAGKAKYGSSFLMFSLL